MAASEQFKSITNCIYVVLLLLILGAGFPLSAERLNQARRTQEESQTIAVYKRANRAVVFITTVTLTLDPFDWVPQVKPQEGSGSGIIVDSERGIILTNLHVIQDAHRIEILLGDGKPLAAKLLGYDPGYDIAVLQLKNPPPDLVSIPFGDSSDLEVGQRVLAIGNPFGLDRTLTSGIISSLDRAVKGSSGVLMKGLIQTDAAINPGNSGGPLLDASGRLIGINTAILSKSGESVGIGFAVPVNPIHRVLPELIATGKVLRPDLGWVLVDTNQGPMVRRVERGGPAALAGVQPIEKVVRNMFYNGYVRDITKADLIVRVNGERVAHSEQVTDKIRGANGSEPIEFVLRSGGIRGEERKIRIRPVLR